MCASEQNSAAGERNMNMGVHFSPFLGTYSTLPGNGDPVPGNFFDRSAKSGAAVDALQAQALLQ
jgi:hypothetical protein